MSSAYSRNGLLEGKSRVRSSPELKITDNRLLKSCATPPARLADLAVLYGGRGRLLRVAEVAEQLGVCNATVYRLCESGELLHLRAVNSIRVRPKDLAEYVGANRMTTRYPASSVRSFASPALSSS